MSSLGILDGRMRRDRRSHYDIDWADDQADRRRYALALIAGLLYAAFVFGMILILGIFVAHRT